MPQATATMKRGARDLAEQPRPRRMPRRRRGHIHQRQHQRGEDGASRLAEIARSEDMWRWRQEILGGDDELRADHRGKHAAGQHPGHDLGPVRLARRVGGGETVGLVRGRVEPAEEVPINSNRKVPCINRAVGDEAGQDAEHRADLQRRAPAAAAGERADRQRTEPHAEHHGGDRQRRQSLVGREHRADDRGRSR